MELGYVSWAGDAAMLADAAHLPTVHVDLVEVIQAIDAIKPAKDEEVVGLTGERRARSGSWEIALQLQLGPHALIQI